VEILPDVCLQAVPSGNQWGFRLYTKEMEIKVSFPALSQVFSELSVSLEL
jgi:hypothetical protein